MNFYDLIEMLVDKVGLQEMQLRDAHKLIATMREMNALGSFAAQSIADHDHNFQWDRVQRDRRCTVCRLLAEDQTPPQMQDYRRW